MENTANLEHPSLKAVEDTLTLTEIRFGEPAAYLEHLIIETSNEVFGADQKLDSLGEKTTQARLANLIPGMRVESQLKNPSYRVALLTHKEDQMNEEGNEHNPRIGMFYFAGTPGSAGQHAHIASELFQSALAEKFGEVVMSGAISSIFSPDTQDNPMLLSNVKKAANLAAFFMELLKDKECDELYFMAHSMSAVDMPYLAPLLNKLFEKQGIPTRVAGVLLYQPGGVAEQGVLPFLLRSRNATSFMSETAFLFPTRMEYEELEYQIGLAEDKGDHTEARRLKILLQEMGAKRNAGEIDPLHQDENRSVDQEYVYQFLSEEEKSEFERIDNQFEDAFFHGETAKAEKLYAQRMEVLKPAIVKAVQNRETHPTDASRITMGKVLLSLFKSDGLLGMVPSHVRSLMDIPIGIVTSPVDPLFPHHLITHARLGTEIAERQILEQDGKVDLLQEARLFPNAPEFFAVKIPNPHMGIVYNADTVTSMAVDVFRRMKESHGQEAQQVVQLQY